MNMMKMMNTKMKKYHYQFQKTKVKWIKMKE